MALLREELLPYVGEKSIETAVLLGVACRYGTDERRLVELTGMDADFVATVAKRMTDNGIWKYGYVGFEKPDEPDHLAVEFILHVLVATGEVVRIPA